MGDVQLSEPVSIWPLRAALLEGPVWVARDSALWFTDIKGHKIHRHVPGQGVLTGHSWDAPGQIGFVLPFAAGGFAAGLQDGIHRFDERDGRFHPIVDPEPRLPGNRLNDATVDPQGRLWFGTMDDSEAEATGAIYRLGADGNCWLESPHYSITNGPAFSPDGKTCYHTDTLGGIIYACDVSHMGHLSNRRVFATIPNEEGYPDGPTVDAEGCVWTGLYKGWAVRRYSPKGELLETIRFPVSAITKIAFGGPDLKTVYATTANKHCAPEDMEKEPHAGDLFRFEVDVPGLPGVEIAG
ncbi:SMP-30/gluconolactonase/LRE family protein [Sphingomonas sp. G-3-2-10]|uniref:SMP-30/gluconolactonase/LRE family protein n=1 Tax=Sphingomonas sp. G-3-2-10 TaxID=2728838 RepID=UPI00146F6C3A|nr:SMP-30/gluconolactonase/LRE family protein [Sphingomonas sp. G-3-2-10]NML05677.1 SMP-30/gluconolactonase/LRE family protein [Sphingomonas sp. G-3-2-10]